MKIRLVLPLATASVLVVVSPFSLVSAASAASVVAAPAEGAQAIKATSRITAATVYPDRAVVSRVAKVAARLGTNEFVFESLPGELLENSVQVAARGAAAASLLDITVRTNHLAAEPDSRLRAAAERIVELRRRELELNDESRLIGAQRSLVETIEQTYLTPAASPGNPAASAPAPARLSLEDYEKFLGFSTAQRRRIEKDARGLTMEQAALAEELSAAEKQFARLQGGQPALRMEKSVTVRLASEAAGELEVTVRYAVPGASWATAYDARLRSAERTVRLDSFGLVRNRTGEDWRDIELTLSTARPGLGGAAPEIVPWKLNVAEWSGRSSSSFFGFSRKPKRPDPSATVIGQQGVLNPNEAGMFGEDAGAGLTVAGLLATRGPTEPGLALREATFAAAKTASGATSATFKIATPVSLASDNTPQRVPTGTKSLSAELSYEATPKLQETAYLAALVKNETGLPFLGGSLNAFLDETFVASARLETTMPGEDFVFDLGADEGISIKRKVLSRFTDERGIGAKTRRTGYEVLTTVTNNKPSSERILVRDVIPVASDEKVQVKLLAPAERDFLKAEEASQPARLGVVRDAEGRIAWRLELKPGEKRELPLKFSIEHPSDLAVSGID